MSAPIARTYLSVPGSRPESFEKALASAADAVVPDHEEAVAVDDKASARDAAGAQLAGMTPEARRRVVVRINEIATRSLACPRSRSTRSIVRCNRAQRLWIGRPASSGGRPPHRMQRSSTAE